MRCATFLLGESPPSFGRFAAPLSPQETRSREATEVIVNQKIPNGLNRSISPGYRKIVGVGGCEYACEERGQPETGRASRLVLEKSLGWGVVNMQGQIPKGHGREERGS